MFLIACAASECLAALERGTWNEELSDFRHGRGVLYQVYMQRKIERLFRKSFETSAEKKHRRRRERILGYEALSIEDYGRLPARKRAGALQNGLEPPKARKRRTKEEVQAFAESKAAARALLKANGLKANGEAISERRKMGSSKGTESPQLQMPPTFADAEARIKAEIEASGEKVTDSKSKKAPRRKYDIPELERIAFAGDVSMDRRMSYDLHPEDHKFKRESSQSKHPKIRLEASRLSEKSSDHGVKYKADIQKDDAPHFTKTERSSDAGVTARSNGFLGDSTRGEHDNGQDVSKTAAQSRSPSQHMSIFNLLERPPPCPRPISNVLDSPDSVRPNASPQPTFHTAPSSPYLSNAVDAQVVRERVSPEKPRTSMSLAALLN